MYNKVKKNIYKLFLLLNVIEFVDVNNFVVNVYCVRFRLIYMCLFYLFEVRVCCKVLV